MITNSIRLPDRPGSRGMTRDLQQGEDGTQFACEETSRCHPAVEYCLDGIHSVLKKMSKNFKLSFLYKKKPSNNGQ